MRVEVAVMLAAALPAVVVGAPLLSSSVVMTR
jgi:hypothetical protein